MYSESLVSEQYIPDMKHLNPEKWASLHPGQRLALLRLAEDKMAAQEGREPRDIVPLTPEEMRDVGCDENTCGFFTAKTPDKLYIKESYLTTEPKIEDGTFYTVYQALETVYHEGRHAFQYDCKHGDASIRARLRKNMDPRILELWEMQDWVYLKDSKKLKLPGDFERYFFQPVEDDANLFALDQLKALEGVLDDPMSLQFYLQHLSEKREAMALRAKLLIGLNFKEIIAKKIRSEYMALSKKPTNAATKQNLTNTLTSTLQTGRVGKFSLIQLAMSGGILLGLFISYLISAPSGFLRNILWFLSAIVPFVPTVLLLGLKTPLQKILRSKIGGIILLVLFAVLMLLIPMIYDWMFLVYLVAAGLFLFRGFTDIMPSTYTVIKKEADGTSTTETHFLGDNAEQEIAIIDAQLRSEGYTKES